jgi:hypothetical protein
MGNDILIWKKVYFSDEVKLLLRNNKKRNQKYIY